MAPLNRPATAFALNLRRNTLWNLAGIVLPLMAALWAIPQLMRGFGLAAFGVLALVWALIGYLALFELGLGRTLTVKLAPMALGAERSTVARCGLALSAVAGLTGGALMWAAAQPVAVHLLKVPLELQAEAVAAFCWAAAGVLPTTSMAAARGILEARGQFALTNAQRTVVGVGGFLVPLASLQLVGSSVAAAVLGIVILRWICWAWAVWSVRDDLTPATGEPLHEPLLARSAELLRFGGWLTVSSIVGPVMVYGDRFFIGAAASLAEVSRYSVVQELVQRLLVLPTAFTNAWLPQLAAHDPAAQREAQRRGQIKFLLLMAVICALAALLLQPALAWWLGAEEAAKMLPMGWILCLGVCFNAWAQWPFTVLHARGQVRATALFHTIQLPLYLILVFALTSSFGLSGAAWAWTLRAALDWLGLEWLMRNP